MCVWIGVAAAVLARKAGDVRQRMEHDPVAHVVDLAVRIVIEAVLAQQVLHGIHALHLGEERHHDTDKALLRPELTQWVAEVGVGEVVGPLALFEHRLRLPTHGHPLVEGARVQAKRLEVRRLEVARIIHEV